MLVTSLKHCRRGLIVCGLYLELANGSVGGVALVVERTYMAEHSLAYGDIRIYDW